MEDAAEEWGQTYSLSPQDSFCQVVAVRYKLDI